MDFYKGDIPIIDDTPEGRNYAMPFRIDGNPVGYGYVPRDYAVDPPEMFDPPGGIQLIPESEWDARFDEQERLQSSLEHIYLGGPGGEPLFENLDQNGHGYCWAYSTGSAVMLQRAVQNQRLVRLNPHSVAAIIKGGRDQGGWCGLSAKFVKENGIASEDEWPRHSRSLSNDTPAVREKMRTRATVEDWVDLTRDVYSQNLTTQMCVTLGMVNVPVPCDFNWWSHSVCQVRWVRIERGSWGRLILNSWKGWGRHGLGVLRGSQATCNGAVAIRATTPS